MSQELKFPFRSKEIITNIENEPILWFKTNSFILSCFKIHPKYNKIRIKETSVFYLKSVNLYILVKIREKKFFASNQTNSMITKLKINYLSTTVPDSNLSSKICHYYVICTISLKRLLYFGFKIFSFEFICKGNLD